jgi:NAD(P)-dependent dehydrogenase (short-subunit alcohol dehydrogenase family)
VLINNAGLKGGFAPPEQRKLTNLSLPVWQRMMDVNVTGAFLCARECAAHMITRRGGAIINISSGAGQSGSNGLYSITKAALNMLNKTLALELREHNISVNALGPGGTEVRERGPDNPTYEPRPNMLRPETSLPVSLYLATQNPIEVTGEYIEVIPWNEAHGFGGREVWTTDAHVKAQAL